MTIRHKQWILSKIELVSFSPPETDYSYYKNIKSTGKLIFSIDMLNTSSPKDQQYEILGHEFVSCFKITFFFKLLILSIVHT